MLNNNVPPGYELFTLPPGKRKIASEVQSSTSTTFTVEREDHSLANLIKGQLLTYPTVSFAGYSMPHPLDHYFVLNIQTMGACNPTDVLRLSLLHLSSTLHTLKNDFEAEIVRYRTKEIDFESEIVRYRKMELDFEDQPIY